MGEIVRIGKVDGRPWRFKGGGKRAKLGKGEDVV